MNTIGVCHLVFDCFDGFDAVGFLLFIGILLAIVVLVGLVVVAAVYCGFLPGVKLPWHR